MGALMSANGKYSLVGTMLYFEDNNTKIGHWINSRRYKREFDDEKVSYVNCFQDKNVIIVGGSSGIGKEVTKKMALSGANVHLLCRNQENAGKLIESIKVAKKDAKVTSYEVDISEFQSIDDFLRSCRSKVGEKLDILVNNAATMPSARQLTNDGNEIAFATNLLGFYRLTKGLIPLLQNAASDTNTRPRCGQVLTNEREPVCADPPRIVNVVSGGMLTTKLNLANMVAMDGGKQGYDGLYMYAQTHRARVMLTAYWSELLWDRPDRIVSNCAHPGWVDTPGLQLAGPMSLFYHALKPLGVLRSEEAGADTIVWLAAGMPTIWSPPSTTENKQENTIKSTKNSNSSSSSGEVGTESAKGTPTVPVPVPLAPLSGRYFFDRVPVPRHNFLAGTLSSRTEYDQLLAFLEAKAGQNIPKV